MPTYTVTTVGLTLSAEQKSDIAQLITTSHAGNTGAPGYFAQVFFQTYAVGDHFFGGCLNNSTQVYIHGLIRAGRTVEQKTGLMAEVAEKAAGICAVGREDVWMYLQDIEAEQMIEYGRVLPAPGAEAEWRAGLSAEKEQALKRDGVNL
jgi:phenylpyruvate tautomerase PptA (4-oxalocrotonate tautomerase family)